MAGKPGHPRQRKTRSSRTSGPRSVPSPPERKAEPASSDEPLEAEIPTVVAVGASAGGLDAFSQILEHLPPSPNVAFVFVQHLSPQHESALPSLLSARTMLPVVQVTDGMLIESNHVYVIPPNVHMEVIDGRLTLLPRPHDRSQFTPIDVFFESLARWAQEARDRRHPVRHGVGWRHRHPRNQGASAGSRSRRPRNRRSMTACHAPRLPPA